MTDHATRIPAPAEGDATSEATPEWLLERVSDGDQPAFAQLYGRFSTRVFELANRIVRDPDKARDVAQEIFLEIWRRASRFDRSRGTGTAGIMTLTHGRSVDRARQVQKSRALDLQAINDNSERDVDIDDVFEAIVDNYDRELDSVFAAIASHPDSAEAHEDGVGVGAPPVPNGAVSANNVSTAGSLVLEVPIQVPGAVKGRAEYGFADLPTTTSNRTHELETSPSSVRETAHALVTLLEGDVVYGHVASDIRIMLTLAEGIDAHQETAEVPLTERARALMQRIDIERSVRRSVLAEGTYSAIQAADLLAGDAASLAHLVTSTITD